MTNQELIRIAVSYISANLGDVEEAMDIEIDYYQLKKLEEELYND